MGRLFVVSICVFATLLLFGGIYALIDIQQTRSAQRASAAEETVVISASAARARAMARRLLAPRLPQLIKPRSDHHDTDAKFLEDLLVEAIISLLRYRDVANSKQMTVTIDRLNNGWTQEAVTHVRRVEDHQIERRDKRGLARSQMHLGAFFLLTDQGGARALLRAAYELDSSLFSCVECLNRFLAAGGMAIATVSGTESAAPTGTILRPNTPASKRAKADGPMTNAKPTAVAPALENPATPAPSRPPSPPDALVPGTTAPPAETRMRLPSKGTLQELQPIRRYEPEYPDRALASEIEGYVVISFGISSSGSTVDVRAIDSHPAGYFEASAEAAVRKWRFSPMHTPVHDMRVRFDFVLR